MDNNKLKSLQKKYHSIPEEHKSYYPDVSHLADDAGDVESEDENEASVSTARKKVKPSRKKRQKRAKHTVKIPGVAVAKKPGRPKNAIVLDSSQRTIVSMFKPSFFRDECVMPGSVNI
jgi:hypothetical protein